MLMAACNVAISTVILGDSRGYKVFGAKGALVTDAVFSLITGTVMLVIIRLYGGRGREHRLSVDRNVELLETAELRADPNR